jgi:hypothetical protein
MFHEIFCDGDTSFFAGAWRGNCSQQGTSAHTWACPSLFALLTGFSSCYASCIL